MTLSFRKIAATAVMTVLAAILFAGTAASEEFKFDFKGSLGPAGKHTRYVPPLANPLLNETPYITTEVRALFIYNDIPDSFLTTGGNILSLTDDLRRRPASA